MASIRTISLLLLFSLSAHAITITIKGTVKDAKTNLPVSDQVVVLKDMKGRIFKDTTNTNGYYEFVFTKNFFIAAIVYVETVAKEPQPGVKVCFSDDIGKFGIDDTTKSDLVFTKDFYLKEVHAEMRFPQVLFKKNSVEYSYSVWELDTTFAKDAVNSLVKVLIDNPSIVVELSCHCSFEEKNVDQLSQKRAEKVKTELIKNTIDEKRVVAKGYGIRKLKISNEQIGKAATDKEKEALRAMNRRCVFKILSWDFPDPNPKKKEEYHPKVSGEEEK